MGGDFITKVDGQPIGCMSELGAILRRHSPGDRIAIEGWHANRDTDYVKDLKGEYREKQIVKPTPFTTTLKIGERPAK